MDKLIITVTCDSTHSYPGNRNCPEPTDTQGVAKEYARSVNAGAAIAHTHGSYRHEAKPQPDGRRPPIPVLEGWQDIVETIRAQCRPILQFGLASMPIEEKIRLWKLGADMNSTWFTAQHEYFQQDPAYPPYEVYGAFNLASLKQLARTANEQGVKLEVEAFHTGSFWQVQELRKEEGLLPDPLWISLFLGWPGGSWTPPTVGSLQYLVANLPPRANWNLSCMTPAVYWPLITHAIALGGHVRVGMEDCPYLEDGTLVQSNAVLVEKAVRIAHELGRDIASPEEARKMIGLPGGIK